MKEILSKAARLGYHTVIAGVVPPNEANVMLHEGFGFVYVATSRKWGFKWAKQQVSRLLRRSLQRVPRPLRPHSLSVRGVDFLGLRLSRR